MSNILGGQQILGISELVATTDVIEQAPTTSDIVSANIKQLTRPDFIAASSIIQQQAKAQSISVITPDLVISTQQLPITTFPFNNISFPGDSDSDVLPYPLIMTTARKRQAQKSISHGKFFILTFEEALAYKRHAAAEKKKKEDKVERQKIRERKKQEKE